MSSADRSYRVSLAGSLIALACVLGLVETALIPPSPVPGVRLGLANVAVLLAFVTLDRWTALVVSLARVGIVGSITGTLLGPVGALSFVGALAAWAAVALLSSAGGRFSIVGWSIGGAAAHSAAQFATAWALIGSVLAPSLLGLALPLAAITGLVTGIIARVLLARLRAPLGYRFERLAGVATGGATTSR